ncbi:MAG: TRAP transporter substrate-binding protein [Planctomycetales bacterium]|nr:TRAP transporter substrate-binding protein [Planctomycetales bacterium]
MNRSVSFFVVGLLTGILCATTGFALMQGGAGEGGNANGGPSSPGSATHVIKVGHVLDQNHPVHKAMERMAERLAELSDGSVELKIFPNGQLGSETELLEQVQRGALAITKVSTAPLESFIPSMAVFGVPYAFQDEDQFWRVIEGEVGHELLASGESIGLVGLCFYDAGARSFYTIDKPILRPDDLRGLKIRVQQSPTAMDMVEALGGAPTPVPFGELYTALHQRMVDGAENNLPSFVSSRHCEVCKHLSLDEHTRVPDILIMNANALAELPTQVQEWVRQAATESAQFQRELWAEQSERDLEAAEAMGVEIHHPDKALFTAKVSEMHAGYNGSAVGDLLARIREQ